MENVKLRLHHPRLVFTRQRTWCIIPDVRGVPNHLSVHHSASKGSYYRRFLDTWQLVKTAWQAAQEIKQKMSNRRMRRDE